MTPKEIADRIMNAPAYRSMSGMREAIEQELTSAIRSAEDAMKERIIHEIQTSTSKWLSANYADEIVGLIRSLK